MTVVPESIMICLQAYDIIIIIIIIRHTKALVWSVVFALVHLNFTQIIL